MRTLDGAADNLTVYRLARIVNRASTAQTAEGVGDEIDRGLMLLKLLREEGFLVVQLEEGEHAICER